MIKNFKEFQNINESLNYYVGFYTGGDMDKFKNIINEENIDYDYDDTNNFIKIETDDGGLQVKLVHIIEELGGKKSWDIMEKDCVLIIPKSPPNVPEGAYM